MVPGKYAPFPVLFSAWKNRYYLALLGFGSELNFHHGFSGNFRVMNLFVADMLHAVVDASSLN
jgi:hypothetical protein